MNAGDGSSACQFFTEAQCREWASLAYRHGVEALIPPDGEPWRVEGVTWSSAALFAWSVHERFSELMSQAAVDAKIPNDSGCASAQLGWDDSGYFSRPEVNDLPVIENPGNNRLHGEECRG